MNRYGPDVLASGLEVVFCGLNPAATAALDGHNFSHRSNRFWEVLHQAGFTDVRLLPAEERRLLTYGCGITAVVARATSRANDVAPEEFRAARQEFERKIRRYRPRAIAFLGKRALSSILGTSRIAFGPQPVAFADTTTWVLPNPSGLNRNYTLADLVAAYSELRVALWGSS